MPNERKIIDTIDKSVPGKKIIESILSDGSRWIEKTFKSTSNKKTTLNMQIEQGQKVTSWEVIKGKNGRTEIYESQRAKLNVSFDENNNITYLKGSGKTYDEFDKPVDWLIDNNQPDVVKRHTVKAVQASFHTMAPGLFKF